MIHLDLLNFSYNFMQIHISSIKNLYPFLITGFIGKSVMGKKIPYLKIGTGKKEIFYSGAIHANEWITSLLLIRFVEEYCLAIVNNSTIYGYNARKIFENTTLYIVPMVNPDGVDLVTDNINKKSPYYIRAKNISSNFPNIPFPSGWKANIEGVDLNLQFPAEWEQAKKIKYSQGFTSPAPRDFVGQSSLITPESLALYNFTLMHDFKLIIAYHTQGKEIYWQFQNNASKEAKKIGEVFASVSSYTLTQPIFNSSFAGYKDWFIQNYSRPGYTIEAGLGENPLPISQFNEIYKDNLGILVLGAILI